MNKIKKTIITLSSFFMFYACESNTPSSTSVIYPDKAGVPTASATSAPGNLSDVLKLSILPSTNTQADIQELSEILSRKVKGEFPLKIGVLLYRNSSLLDSEKRKNYFNNFLTKIKENPNVGNVVQIPNTLLVANSTIEDLRRLTARFQVSTLLIIEDIYYDIKLSKSEVSSPLDVILGDNYWESSSNIDIFALDILNGVFVSSLNSNFSTTEKYNRNKANVTGSDSDLISKNALKTWEDMSKKVSDKIDEFKKSSETVTK